MKRYALWAAFGALMSTEAAVAAPIFLTDRADFLAASGASQLETFDSALADQSFNTSPFSYGVFTFSVDGPGVESDRNKIDSPPDPGIDFNGQPIPGQTDVNGTPDLNLRSDDANSVVFSFASPLSAIGFDLTGYVDDQVEGGLFSVYNGADLLGSYAAVPTGELGTLFLGVYGAGPITSIRFSSDTVDVFGLDNIAFAPEATAAVPEAPTWAAMILGFGLVGLGLRGRRKALAA